jgi:hypothetical protein
MPGCVLGRGRPVCVTPYATVDTTKSLDGGYGKGETRKHYTRKTH